MTINHEEYLKRTLSSNKLELDKLNIEHRIAIAQYEVKKEMLTKQNDSIERQLDDNFSPI